MHTSRLPSRVPTVSSSTVCGRCTVFAFLRSRPSPIILPAMMKVEGHLVCDEWEANGLSVGREKKKNVRA